MKLSVPEKEEVLNELRKKYQQKYGINQYISDSVDVKVDSETYQVFTIINDKVKIVFVLFDANNHSQVDGIVRQICQTHKYEIGHSVHCQFVNGIFYSIFLSGEIL